MSDYDKGYAKGRSTGERKGDERASAAIAERDQAVRRAERAEAAQGFGKCRDCAHWSRGAAPDSPEARSRCRWGGCTPPRSQFIGSGPEGSPLWFGHSNGSQQAITTSESFGCVLFRAKQEIGQ